MNWPSLVGGASMGRLWAHLRGLWYGNSGVARCRCGTDPVGERHGFLRYYVRCPGCDAILGASWPAGVIVKWNAMQRRLALVGDGEYRRFAKQFKRAVKKVKREAANGR